jgi:hypothetical protein
MALQQRCDTAPNVDYVELMVQVMKTSLEPQRHGTSKEVKILSTKMKKFDDQA